MISAKLVRAQTTAMGRTHQNLVGGITYSYMTHDVGADAAPAFPCVSHDWFIGHGWMRSILRW